MSAGRGHIIFGREYPRSYDAIVIGSGVGGLFCANLLAKGGLSVLMLERHFTLGGFCSTFRRKGFVFDAATHFYPLLGNPQTLTGGLMRELEIPTEWVRMDPVDQFHFPGMPAFEVPASLDEYVAKLQAWFPREASRIDGYFAEMRQAYLAGLLYYFKGVPNECAKRLERYTVRQKLEEWFRDPRLRALLVADCLHWGSPPDRISYVFDAMLRLGYFLGNYYPRGGSQKFIDDLGRGLERRGGKILKCAEAVRIAIEGGTARGVVARTVSHRPPEEFEFRAPAVISNADAHHTFRNLVGEENCSPEILDALKSMTPSLPCFLVHIGLKGMDPGRLAAADGYHWSCFDPADSVRNAFKIFVPTRYDSSIAPPGCQILIVQKLSPLPFAEITDWQAHKAEIEAGIMARLRQVLPDIDQHIVEKSCASALTSYRYTGNSNGAMLGWEMSPGQLGAGRLPISTPVRNLYMVGHWTQPGGGVTPVIVSAQRAARAVLDARRHGPRVGRNYLERQFARAGGRFAMTVQVCGFDGPLARATRAELELRGHVLTGGQGDCAVFFPRPLGVDTPSGSLDELARLAGSGVRRLVLRSHAYAYGSHSKNPGLMTEDRISLLREDVAERQWLEAEAIAARHRNWAAVRLTNVLAAEEGGLLVRQISSRVGISLAGRDPNVQFISVSDAARALAAAVESQAVGLFNAAADGAIPLKKVFRAAGAIRVPLPKPLAHLFSRGADVDQLQYNWTVSAERAARDLGFTPAESSLEALRAFLAGHPRAKPDRLRENYDDWGLDLDYIRAWGWWFAFLRKFYWRIEHEGIENVPAEGRALLVANHRGFMPLDGVMHLSLLLTRRQRVVRFLIIPCLLRQPFLSNFLTKLGGVIASQENAARLCAAENLVGIFPEGIFGAFTPYKHAYRLHDFAEGAFARIAIENQAPVIPAAVVGHAEIFPIVGRIQSSFIQRELGWPYFPIAPPFPLAPIPIPSKWHVRYLPPVPLGGLKPADAENRRLVREFSHHVQHIIQRNLDDMVSRRRSIFFGKVLDGTSPHSPAFHAPMGRPVGKPVGQAR